MKNASLASLGKKNKRAHLAMLGPGPWGCHQLEHRGSTSCRCCPNPHCPHPTGFTPHCRALLCLLQRHRLGVGPLPSGSPRRALEGPRWGVEAALSVYLCIPHPTPASLLSHTGPAPRTQVAGSFQSAPFYGTSDTLLPMKRSSPWLSIQGPPNMSLKAQPTGSVGRGDMGVQKAGSQENCHVKFWGFANKIT